MTQGAGRSHPARGAGSACGRVLPPRFYERPTLQVARDLIGLWLVHDTPAGRTAGEIVEVEAYIGESDPACHAAAGWTPRTSRLYGPPGRAYVYLNYGIHYLVNAVTEAEGVPGAVLVRALRPVIGQALMRTRRGMPVLRDDRGAEAADVGLCRGPGNLTRALGIGAAHNGRTLDGTLRITWPAGAPRRRPGTVDWTPRIGIRVGIRHRWRGVRRGSPHATRAGR